MVATHVELFPLYFLTDWVLFLDSKYPDLVTHIKIKIVQMAMLQNSGSKGENFAVFQ